MGIANVAFKVDQKYKDRMFASIKNFKGVNSANLLRNAIETHFSGITVPKEFIDRFNINFIIKSGMPIRTVLPYMASYANLSITDDFTITNEKGNKIKVDPYPEYGLICIITIAEKLYRAMTVLENG